MPRVLLPLFAALALASCSLVPAVGRRPLRPEQASAELVEVRADLDRGDPEDALERLELLHRARNLTPEDRQTADRFLLEAMDALVAGAREGRYDARDLSDVFGLDLPRGARARAGVEAAARLYDEGHPVSCYKMVRKVEFALPAHSERARAGDVLARTGFDLADRSGRYYLLFSYRERGVEALEFLVGNYPFHPTCEEAYRKLASLYEADGDLDEAIERLEDLLVYHPDSPRRAEVEARLPALRLARLTKDEYDRGELVLARDELEAWLARYRDHPLHADVEATLAVARTRLARSDLTLARYYARVDVPFGVRLHASRAVEEARIADASAELEEAQALLARFPESAIGEADGALPPPAADSLQIEDALGPVVPADRVD